MKLVLYRILRKFLLLLTYIEPIDIIIMNLMFPLLFWMIDKVYLSLNNLSDKLKHYIYYLLSIVIITIMY